MCLSIIFLIIFLLSHLLFMREKNICFYLFFKMTLVKYIKSHNDFIKNIF